MSILAETANKVPMDDKDYKILDELQKDGRITNQELSERVNLSATPCLRRVRILEEAGIIRGYCAVVDQKALGLAVTAFIRIRLERHDDETVQGVEKAISNMPEVMDCWLMTGQWDYQMRVLSTDLEAYEKFVRNRLQRVQGIASIDTSFAYGRVKRSQIVPHPER